MMEGVSEGPTVAYQGGPGANGERAIVARWGGAAHPLSMRSFPSLVTAVADGTADFGVVPVWNSTIGRVHDGEEALAAAGDRVEPVDEVMLPVRHALLALPGTRLDTVRAVGSHHVALLQCRRFFIAHPEMTAVPAWDTAGAARELSFLVTGGDGEAWVAPWYATVPAASADALAVIAHPGLAASLGLTVLADGIEDDPANATRFVVVQPRRSAWRW